MALFDISNDMIQIAVLSVFAVFVNALPLQNQGGFQRPPAQAPPIPYQQVPYSNPYPPYQGQTYQYQQPDASYQPGQIPGDVNSIADRQINQPVPRIQNQQAPYYNQYPQYQSQQTQYQQQASVQAPAPVNTIGGGPVTQPAPTSDGPCQDCTCDKTTGVCTPNNPNSGEKASAPTVSPFQNIQVMAMDNSMYTIPAKNKVDGCTKYTPEFKCGKCDDDKYLDSSNNKCEKLTKMPLCLTPEPNGTPNAETGLISCAECESPNVPVIDTKNANYQFCIRPPQNAASGFNPIFILDQGQYLCLTTKQITENDTNKKYTGLVPLECSNAQFDDWSLFQSDYENNDPSKYQGIRTKATDNSGTVHIATFHGRVMNNELAIVYVGSNHIDQIQERYFVSNGTNFLLHPPNGNTKYTPDRCMGLAPQVDNPSEKMLAMNAGNCVNMGFLIYVQNPTDPGAAPPPIATSSTTQEPKPTMDPALRNMK